MRKPGRKRTKTETDEAPPSAYDPGGAPPSHISARNKAAGGQVAVHGRTTRTASADEGSDQDSGGGGIGEIA